MTPPHPFILNKPSELRDFWPAMPYPLFSQSTQANELDIRGDNWRIKAVNETSKLPTLHDQKILVGLWSMVLADINSGYLSSNYISIVKSDLCEVLRKTNSGSDYNRIKLSFERLVHTKYFFQTNTSTLIPKGKTFKWIESFTSNRDGYHIQIPTWFMEILKHEQTAFLKINPAFLKMKPLESALYRIALRSVSKNSFRYRFETIRDRLNSNQSKSKLLKRIYQISASKGLIDFDITVEASLKGYSLIFSKVRGVIHAEL